MLKKKFLVFWLRLKGGRNLKRFFRKPVSCLVIFSIRLYQKFSKHTAEKCRYYPSCSCYAVKVIEKYGAFKGGFLALRRLSKCNFFFRGGIDDIK